MRLLRLVMVALTMVPSVATVNENKDDVTNPVDGYTESNRHIARFTRRCSYRCPKNSRPKRYAEPRARRGGDVCDDLGDVCEEGYDDYCFNEYCFPSGDLKAEASYPSCLYEKEYKDCKRKWKGKCKKWKKDCKDSSDDGRCPRSFDDCACNNGYEKHSRQDKCVRVKSSSSDGCRKDSDCGRTRYCLQGSCKNKKKERESCSDGRKCLSGCCSRGKCAKSSRCDSSSSDRSCSDTYKYKRCNNTWSKWCRDWEDICEDSSDSFSDYCADEHCFKATFAEGKRSCLRNRDYKDCLDEWKDRCRKWKKMCPRPADQCFKDWC